MHILPSQWDRYAGKVIGKPNRQAINTYIGNRKQSADNILLKLLESGEIAGIDVAGIKRRITDGLCPDRREEKDGLFASRFLKFASVKKERSIKAREVGTKRIKRNSL